MDCQKLVENAGQISGQNVGSVLNIDPQSSSTEKLCSSPSFRGKFGGLYAAVTPPLSTFCSNLGVFDDFVPLVLGCGWSGVEGGVKNSPAPDEFGDGGGDGCGEF